MSTTSELRRLANELMLDFNTAGAQLQGTLPHAGAALAHLGSVLANKIGAHHERLITEILEGRSPEAIAINHVRMLEEKPPLDFSYQGLLSPGWEPLYFKSPEGAAAQKRLQRAKSFIDSYVQTGDHRQADLQRIKQRDFETTIDFDAWKFDMTVRSLLTGVEFSLPADEYLPVKLIEERYLELESRFQKEGFIYSETEGEISQRLIEAVGLLPMLEDDSSYFEERLVWITPNQKRVIFQFENILPRDVNVQHRQWRLVQVNGRNAMFENHIYLLNCMLADVEHIVFCRKLVDECVEALEEINEDEAYHNQHLNVPVDTLIKVLGEGKPKALIRIPHPEREEIGAELIFSWDPTTKAVKFEPCHWHGARWDNVIETMDYFPSSMKIDRYIPDKLRKHLCLLFTHGTFIQYTHPTGETLPCLVLA